MYLSAYYYIKDFFVNYLFISKIISNKKLTKNLILVP